MKSVKRGDVVLYETRSGRRRVGLVDRVNPGDYPPAARIRPLIQERQKWGGRQRVQLDAIIRRVREPAAAEVAAILDAPRLPFEPD